MRYLWEKEKLKASNSDSTQEDTYNFSHKKHNLESESERFITGYCTPRHISTFTIVKKQLKRFRTFPGT